MRDAEWRGVSGSVIRRFGFYRRRLLFLAAALLVCALASVSSAATARELVTAETFFEDVAHTYAAIEDYQADVVIAMRRFEPVAEDVDDILEETDRIGEANNSEETDASPLLQEVEVSRMEGVLSFKRPDLLRIDFTDPEGGVMVSNSELLTVYLPEFNLIIEQRLDDEAAGVNTSLPTDLTPIIGLGFLRANYAIAYELGPDPVPLGDGSGQQVVRLVLERRVPEEKFETIEVAVGNDKLIRSIVGEYRSGDRWAIEFRSVLTNRSIPNARFQYEPPPDANIYRDVLSGPREG